MTPQAIQILGAAATLYGLGGALSVLLQARRMHVRGASDDVSARFFAVYVGGFAIWLLYGLGIGDFPIIVVHAVGLICGTVTLAVTLRLRRPAVRAASTRPAGEGRARSRPVPSQQRASRPKAAPRAVRSSRHRVSTSSVRPNPVHRASNYPLGSRRNSVRTRPGPYARRPHNPRNHRHRTHHRQVHAISA